MWTNLKQFVKSLLPLLGEFFAAPSIKQILLRQEIRQIRSEIKTVTPRNPTLNGYKVFSQTDEDGIIEEIFNRIGNGSRFFIEIGCGNGSENNTHYLLLRGWRGGWVDANTNHISHIARSFPLKTSRLWVRSETIGIENVSQVAKDFLEWGNVVTPDFFSLDIDGNDLFVIQAITRELSPRVLSVEYNAKFPPALALTIAHNPAHRWMRDDYHGASLQAFVDALPGYRLVACSMSGANAFFVRGDLAEAFEDYSVGDLYQPARHYLAHLRVSPKASLKYLRDLVGS